jgi:hypothetical protein
MKREIHFDVSRIVGIEIFDRSAAMYKWLPRKQKTAFFGLVKLNKYYEEGFYMYGSYKSGGYDTEWDQTPSTGRELKDNGYLVDPDNTVWNRPKVTVHLEHKQGTYQSFETYEQALAWVNNLKSLNGRQFEIVKHG